MAEKIMIPAWGLLVIGLAGVGFGWHSRSVYEDAQELREAKAAINQIYDDQKMAVAVSESVQTALTNLSVTNRTINNEVRREIVEKPIYRDCVLPDSGRMQLDAAIDAANTAGRLGASVPGNEKASK